MAVDALADDLDLTPFFELMRDTNVVKVFHAARQDLEIIWNLSKSLPSPVFDTQVAAMVCGFGERLVPLGAHGDHQTSSGSNFLNVG